MGEKLGKEDWMRLGMMVAGLLAAVTVAVPAALGAGTDPKASATFLGAIQVKGKTATLKVRYQCSAGATGLWVSAKQTKSGVSAAKLMKEGSSRVAATWWDSHRNRFVCNGKAHTATVTIDTVEKGKKGVFVPGTAWVQFCVTKGHTEKDTVLLLSKSAWVHVQSAS